MHEGAQGGVVCFVVTAHVSTEIIRVIISQEQVFGAGYLMLQLIYFDVLITVSTQGTNTIIFPALIVIYVISYYNYFVRMQTRNTGTILLTFLKEA